MQFAIKWNTFKSKASNFDLYDQKSEKLASKNFQFNSETCFYCVKFLQILSADAVSQFASHESYQFSFDLAGLATHLKKEHEAKPSAPFYNFEVCLVYGDFADDLLRRDSDAWELLLHIC